MSLPEPIRGRQQAQKFGALLLQLGLAEAMVGAGAVGSQLREPLPQEPARVLLEDVENDHQLWTWAASIISRPCRGQIAGRPRIATVGAAV